MGNDINTSKRPRFVHERFVHLLRHGGKVAAMAPTMSRRSAALAGVILLTNLLAAAISHGCDKSRSTNGAATQPANTPDRMAPAESAKADEQALADFVALLKSRLPSGGDVTIEGPRKTTVNLWNWEPYADQSCRRLDVLSRRKAIAMASDQKNRQGIIYTLWILDKGYAGKEKKLVCPATSPSAYARELTRWRGRLVLEDQDRDGQYWKTAKADILAALQETDTPAKKTQPAMSALAPAPDGIQKPADLRLSGINVFKTPERTHELLRNVNVVLKFSDPDARLFFVQTAFGAGQEITWAPLRSSRPPEYRFRGHWEVADSGELEIRGRYEPSGGAADVPAHLRDKDLQYAVTTATIHDAAPPYTHTLELRLQRRSATSQPATQIAHEYSRRIADVLPKGWVSKVTDKHRVIAQPADMDAWLGYKSGGPRPTLVETAEVSIEFGPPMTAAEYRTQKEKWESLTAQRAALWTKLPKSKRPIKGGYMDAVNEEEADKALLAEFRQVETEIAAIWLPNGFASNCSVRITEYLILLHGRHQEMRDEFSAAAETVKGIFASAPLGASKATQPASSPAVGDAEWMKRHLAYFDEALASYVKSCSAEPKLPADSAYAGKAIEELARIIVEEGGGPWDGWESLNAFLLKTKDKPEARKALAAALLAKVDQIRATGKWSVCLYQHGQWHSLLWLGDRPSVLKLMESERLATCCGCDALMMRVVAFGQREDAWALLRHFAKDGAEGWLHHLNGCMVRLTGAKTIPAGAITNRPYDEAFRRQAIKAWEDYLIGAGIKPPQPANASVPATAPASAGRSLDQDRMKGRHGTLLLDGGAGFREAMFCTRNHSVSACNATRPSVLRFTPWPAWPGRRISTAAGGDYRFSASLAAAGRAGMLWPALDGMSKR